MDSTTRTLLTLYPGVADRIWTLLLSQQGQLVYQHSRCVYVTRLFRFF